MAVRSPTLASQGTLLTSSTRIRHDAVRQGSSPWAILVASYIMPSSALGRTLGLLDAMSAALPTATTIAACPGRDAGPNAPRPPVSATRANVGGIFGGQPVPDHGQAATVIVVSLRGAAALHLTA
jgi:hypothetical protein